MDAEELEVETRAADQAALEARARFVAAVRQAHASGLSQREIARRSGRSQSEVNRLLRFHGSSPRARQLRRRRSELVSLFAEAGIDNIRVFGSVATGRDGVKSDVDLLVTPNRPIGLLGISRLEQQASELVGLPVDLVLDNSIRPDLRERVLAEAVPL